jgi:hypothetical protein
LKFIGSVTNKLFQLKWISFSNKSAPITASTRIGKTDELLIYPNPAKDHLSVFSGFPYNQVEIFSMSGRMVFRENNEAVHSSMLNLHLDSGSYILKICNDKEVASVKLMIEL